MRIKNLFRSIPAILIFGLIAFISSPAAAQTQKDIGKVTLYYLAEVKPRAEGGGGARLRFAHADGKFQRFRLSPGDLNKANAKGNAFARRPDGSIIAARMVSPDLWTDLPAGWYGTGNKANPLVPFRIASADQRHHPYGSRIFVPAAVGKKTPEGKPLDGYFWVGDTGKGINGAFRFDIFVGLEPVYHEILKSEDGRWSPRVEVEAPPAPPTGLDYRSESGRKKILERLGYDVEGPLENFVEGFQQISDQGTSVESALIDFQKQHPHIPRLEYGHGNGAVTRWFLAKAAEALDQGKSYPAGPKN